MKKRVHILSAVNAANVSKAGATYTIRDVCGAVDGIVMNRMLYPGEQLANSASSLEGKPAPAGHPKNAAGQFISAANGEALFTAYVGAYARNARHEGGRTMVDILVNEAQAKAHPDGLKLIERLDAAITGTNAEPIHVSTGLFCEPITANGESGGKKYDRVATQIRYDHLAILLNEQGAGTPEQGVGMFLNDSTGQAEEIEAVVVNVDPEDKRSAGLIGWLKKLLAANGSEISFDQITSGLYAQMPEGAWIQEVYARYAIWRDRDGKLWKQDYSVSSDGASVAFSGTAEEVRREVSYSRVNNTQKGDPMKETLVAALNAAGIKTEGMADAQILAAYNALVANSAVAPVKAELDAANAKLQTMQANADAATQNELTAIATELATNSAEGLASDHYKALGLDTCRTLKANRAKAAPVLPGAGAASLNAAYNTLPE